MSLSVISLVLIKKSFQKKDKKKKNLYKSLKDDIIK